MPPHGWSGGHEQPVDRLPGGPVRLPPARSRLDVFDGGLQDEELIAQVLEGLRATIGSVSAKPELGPFGAGRPRTQLAGRPGGSTA